MQSRKHSLTLAKQFRTCPPMHVREDPAHRHEYERHLAVCPYCSGPNTGERDAWEALAGHLAALSGEGREASAAEAVAPGQLRCIRDDRAVWQEDLYFTPPVVLVLQTAAGTSEDLLVAQTYPDIALAGPGDLILTSQHTPVGDLVVECWNVYTLKASDLGKALGSVDSEIMSAVRSLAEDPGACPSWAMAPRPLTKQDPRIHFRKLESEVGRVFSSKSVSRAMFHWGSPGLKLVYDSPDALRGAIRKIIPGAHWKQPCLSREEVLTMLELPTERLPLAADTASVERISVNLVRLRAGEVISVEPSFLEICGQSGSLVVSGRVCGLPPMVQHPEFICFLDPEGMRPLRPVRQEWRASTGDFVVAFDFEADAPWRLKAALLFESTEA